MENEQGSMYIEGNLQGNYLDLQKYQRYIGIPIHIRSKPQYKE